MVLYSHTKKKDMSVLVEVYYSVSYVFYSWYVNGKG